MGRFHLQTVLVMQRQQGGVVIMITAVFKLVHFLTQHLHHFTLVFILRFADDTQQPLVSEKALVRRLRFGHAVGIEQQLVAGTQLDAVLLVTDQLFSAEDKIRLCPQKIGLGAGAYQNGIIVTGVAVGEPAVCQIENAKPAGHKEPLRIGAKQIAVGLLQHLVGGAVRLRIDLYQRFCQRHKHRRRHAVSGNIAHHDRQMGFVDQKEIIKVAAHLRRRRHVGIDGIGGVVGKILGQDPLLHIVRDLQLCFRAHILVHQLALTESELPIAVGKIDRNDQHSHSDNQHKALAQKHRQGNIIGKLKHRKQVRPIIDVYLALCIKNRNHNAHYADIRHKQMGNACQRGKIRAVIKAVNQRQYDKKQRHIIREYTERIHGKNHDKIVDVFYPRIAFFVKDGVDDNTD